MGILDALFGNDNTDKGNAPSTGSSWNKDVIQGTINGHEVTAIVGKEGTAREGHTLITDGIVGKTALDAKHDHFSPDSKAGDRGDRGHSNVPNS